jgi:rubrerythrin
VLAALLKSIAARLAVLKASSAHPSARDHTRDASPLRCRNCGTTLDYTHVACPACGRRITRFSLKP